MKIYAIEESIMFLKKNNLYLIILLFLPCGTFSLMLTDNNQENASEQIIVKKKTLITKKNAIFLSLTALALLYWLSKGRYTNLKFEKSNNKKQYNDVDKARAELLRKETECLRKKKDRYNKEYLQTVNYFLIYKNNGTAEIKLKNYLSLEKNEREKSFNKIGNDIIDDKIYYEEQCIQQVEEIEKIKLYCLFRFFSDKSSDYCNKIASITSETFPHNFDFYAHQKEWGIIPTDDAIFALLGEYIFLDDKSNSVCFGTKESNFSIQDIDAVYNLLVGSVVDDDTNEKKSITTCMMAIQLALLKNNSLFVEETLVPRLKILLEQGYALSDTQTQYWFEKFISTLKQHSNTTMQTILTLLDCFYPTEYLLSKECLTAKEMNAFSYISHKIQNTFNAKSQMLLIWDEDNKVKLESLYQIVLCAAQIQGDTTLFDCLFTKENLQKEWLNNLLNREGVINADVIWQLLKDKEDDTKEIILHNIQNKTLKNTLELFETDNSHEYSSISTQLSLDSYDLNFDQMNDLFFTSSDRFTQLFYGLMENKYNFTQYMRQIFTLELLDTKKNPFLDFVQYRFVNNNDTAINYTYNRKNDPLFLRNTTAGMMITSDYYNKQINNNGKHGNSLINKYSITRDNTLLLLRWYNIHCAIELYEKTSELYPDFFNNKEQLAKTFKENLAFYKSDFKEQNNNRKINVAATYHLLAEVEENSLYNLEKKQDFANENKWIKKNDMSQFIAREIFALGNNIE